MSVRSLLLCWACWFLSFASAKGQEDTTKFRTYFNHGIHLSLGANPFSKGLQMGVGTQLSYQFWSRFSLTAALRASFYEDIKDYRFINLVERQQQQIFYLEIREGTVQFRNFQINLPLTLRWEFYKKENKSWFVEGSWHRIYEQSSTRWFDYQEGVRYLSERRDLNVPSLLTIRTGRTTMTEQWTGWSIGLGFKVRPKSRYPFSMALHYQQNKIRHPLINPTTHELFTLQMNFYLFSFGGLEVFPPQ